MTRPLYLARASLRRDAPATALARLLVPGNAHARTAAAHHLVWALYADRPDRTRDFLWHEEKPGRFLALGARAPTDPHHLFELQVKEFAPALAAGDRLAFRLRANPTVARGAGGARSKPCDVVMDALHTLPKGERAQARRQAIETAGRAWLARQASRCGFALLGDPAVDGYLRRRIPRGGGPDAVLATLDFEGLLSVGEPEKFLAALTAGIGRGKAFGCGLMLIRRAG
jgi:CRISPR system Cascade subunit CasE